MDSRALIWAAGVADAGLHIKVSEDKRREIPKLEMRMRGRKKTLEVWAQIMRIGVPRMESRGPMYGERLWRMPIPFREQERVARELLPYSTREEELGFVVKAKELSWKRGKKEERVALYRLWREVKEGESEQKK